MLERLFRSRAEVAVLNIVLFTEGLHLREIARRADVSSCEAKKELDNLVDLGILNSEKKGNQVLFHTNPQCSFLPDLQNLFNKTGGIIRQIKLELAVMKEIKYCLIFGSTARGRISEKSDIDLLIVSDISEDKIDSIILKLQKKTKRAINFILWTEKDFKKKLHDKSTFLGNISKKKFIWISGDENEFVRLIEETYD